MKYKKILIPIVILILISIGIVIYLNFFKTTTIKGKILVVGKDYLLVESSNNEDYVINTDEFNYKTGDLLELKLTKINKKKSPFVAKSKKITILKENTSNRNEILEEKINNQNNQENNIVKNNQDNNINEEDIISYFKNIDNELENYNDNNQINSNIKEKFIKCIDFIFYDKEINGKKFSELTNKTKLKILEITLSIDSKIEKHFPKYKEDISSTYQNIKSKIVEKYLEITTNICEKDQELCNNAKENFQKIKKTFGITWNIIKEITKNGVTKIKDWYEIWKDK